MSQCMVIAEVGQAHDGNMGLAHTYIDAIAKAGSARRQVSNAYRECRKHPRRALASQVQSTGRNSLRLLAPHGIF
jgi:sialic acid synthase SpsE